MGSGCLVIYPLFAEALNKEAMSLILLGLAFYGFGIIFFLLGEYKPIYHSIWHIFVVAAACSHWFAIYFFVVQVELTNSPTKTVVTDIVDSMSMAASVTASMVQAAANMSYS
jgi:hypothetical protein